MPHTIENSVLIAAFNEAPNIEACVRAVHAHTCEETEILVIDGGHDNTDEILAALSSECPRMRYIRNENDRGKGHAIRRGIAEAKGKVHIQFDADLQFIPEDIRPLASKVHKGECDVALGSRFTLSSQRDRDATALRNFGNWAISAYASLLFGQRMTDVLAGIKAWSAEAARTIDLRSDDFAYEVEIPARALQRGLQVNEYPIGTRARVAGESKVSILGSGSAILAATTRFRFTK